MGYEDDRYTDRFKFGTMVWAFVIVILMMSVHSCEINRALYKIEEVGPMN